MDASSQNPYQMVPMMAVHAAPPREFHSVRHCAHRIARA